MRVLITGGAGFIGSHLCDALLERGDQVDIIDDLSTGKFENISRLLDNPKFRFVDDSVLNEKMMYLLIERCDIIYHLAAAVGVQLIVDEPVRTIETNIRGTEIVLNLAKKFRKKVLLASTSEIYGKSTHVPFKEEDDRLLGSTIYSRWSYSTSKAVDEFLGLAYAKQYQLPVVITRFFNTVGPRQTGQYGMVIPRFTEAALQNRPLRVFGSGKQTRCFGYVGDVVRAIIALMEKKEAEGEIFNVGSDQEISIADLAEKIIRLTGSQSEIKYISYEEAYGQPFDDMERRVPSLDKISRTIGYHPEVDLEELLMKVIEYSRQKMKAEGQIP
ncbi:MAG: GDP-mannose 4,6-dehydratase [Desulfococcaceae bacterium]|jgi:UDP-glucose 4-epimerase|nr:GDP-mannose 4,6-dehydratase [Desulfococcaceae bacterium]